MSLLSRWKVEKSSDAVVSRPQWKITHGCLEMIFESAKSSFPREFGGLLRKSDVLDHTISEVLLLPGTVSGNTYALFRLYMKPIDFSIVGSVHSHPSGNVRPSDADVNMFGKSGFIHIIVGSPYDMSSWRAYDQNGDVISLQVV